MEQTATSVTGLSTAPQSSSAGAADPSATPATRSIARRAHEAVDRMADLASHGAESLEAQGRRLGEAGTKAVEGSRSYIRSHPGTSIGIALAAGFLIRHFIRMR